jgi:hypothetical protein
MTDRAPPLADGIAVSASLLCLAHCLALPVLAAALPAFGLLLGHSALVHGLLLAGALPLGLWALARGRHSAGPQPLIVGLSGFALMAAALLLPEAGERALTVAGVSLVAVAHWRNWRAGQSAQDTSAASDIL